RDAAAPVAAVTPLRRRGQDLRPGDEPRRERGRRADHARRAVPAGRARQRLRPRACGPGLDARMSLAPPHPLSHAAMAARIAPLVRRLPMQPPAFALAKLLNRLLLPRLPEDARVALSHRTVQVSVTDLGLELKLQLG